MAATALAGILAGGEAARAACDPVAGNGVTATCTGVTTNQNNPFGYGGAFTNLNVTVVSGASVTGATDGIIFNTGTVTNFGTISGVGSSGIAAGTANVTNFGTISGGAFGIAADTANVTNSGTISGGINTVTAANVINSGAISGGSNSGIVGNAVNVTNSGSIAGGTFGISSAIANVTNSGTISGGIFDGIFATTANVTNSGTIAGNVFGIRAVTTANVTNSGTISGGTAALQLAGAADTLTLLPGSHIVGAINLGGGSDTVNVRAPNQNLTFSTLAGATVTSTLPFVVSGNRIVTIDPTSFGTTDRNLMDFLRGLSAAIPDIDMASGSGAPLAFSAPESADRIGDAFASIPGLAYAGEADVFKSPTALHSDGTASGRAAFSAAARRMPTA